MIDTFAVGGFASHIDLFGVPVVLAQAIPWEQGKLNPTLVLSQVALLQMSYMFVTVAMALDRVLAVFTPFKYKAYRRQMVKIVALVFCATITFIESSLMFVSVFSPESVLLIMVLHIVSEYAKWLN